MTATYNSTTDEVLWCLRDVEPLLHNMDLSAVYAELAPVLADCPFALAALDVAAHDLAARLAGMPLYEHLGLASPQGRASSYSVGLDTLDMMVAKLDRTPGWGMYKVKLRKADDLDVLRALREHTDAPFWVDGNACWQPEPLFEVLDELPALGVVALEQPFGVDAVEDQREARGRSPVPVFADESVTTPDQVRPAAEIFDGVNVKVLKAGGLTPALSMLRECRQLGVATMLGCLPESSTGASAAAHLVALTDHVDLDTIALLDTDTGTGVRLTDAGRLMLVDGPGTGFVPDFSSPAWERTEV